MNVTQHQARVHCNPIYKQNCIHTITGTDCQLLANADAPPSLTCITCYTNVWKLFGGTGAQTHWEDL